MIPLILLKVRRRGTRAHNDVAHELVGVLRDDVWEHFCFPLSVLCALVVETECWNGKVSFDLTDFEVAEHFVDDKLCPSVSVSWLGDAIRPFFEHRVRTQLDHVGDAVIRV